MSRSQPQLSFTNYDPAQPARTRPAPAPALRKPVDSALCYSGNQIMLRHQWSVAGPCKICKAPYK